MNLAGVLIAAILLQAQAAMFAPPLAVPIHIVTGRTQGEGDKRRTVRMERLIRFTRDGAGYRAEVLLLSADTGVQDGANAMLQAGFAGLSGRTMAFRLDGAGKVILVEDRQALWDLFCASVLKMVLAKHGNGSREQAALAEQMAAPLRALPPERQQAMLASLVTALIAEDAGDPPGTRAVRIPGASPFGGAVTLTGTQTISTAGIATHRATRAAADVTGGRVELEIDRDVDPRTGLIASAAETLRTTIGEGADAKHTERISTVRVTLQPGRAWPD